MIKLKKIYKVLLESNASNLAKRLGLYHLGYGKYAHCENFQCKVVAFSKKGVLKFVGHDKDLWQKKLNDLMI
jgi:hypothetical protein